MPESPVNPVVELAKLTPSITNSAYRQEATRLAKSLKVEGYCRLQLHKQQASTLKRYKALVFSHLLTADQASGGAGTCIRLLPSRNVLEFTAVADAATRPVSWRQEHQDAALQVTQALDDIARAVLSAVGFAKGLRTQELNELLLDDVVPQCDSVTSSSVLHAVQYKPMGTTAESKSVAERETHEDRGLLTVIACDQPGLQVLHRSDEWKNITLSHDQVLVFGGYTLQYATAGAVHALIHRVEPPVIPSAARISLAYKLRARPDAKVDPSVYTYKPHRELPISFRRSLTGAQVQEQFQQLHTGSVNGVSESSMEGRDPTLHVGSMGERVELHQRTIREARMAQGGDTPVSQTGLAVTRAREIAQAAIKREAAGTSRTAAVPAGQDGNSNGEAIVIGVAIQEDGQVVHFRVNPSTITMSKIMDVLTQRLKLDRPLYRLSFDGVRVNPYSSASSLGMEDGDILVLSRQHLGD